MRMDVLVLMGGPDAEREVSLMSGRAVAAALRDCGRFTVREEVIDRPGSGALAALGGDVIFPVLHGPWGEGGGIQRLLEQLDVPYVGSAPAAAALAMNKMATKALVARHGVATPQAAALGEGDPCPVAPPLVLKPIDDGSSVDLVVCRSVRDIEAARPGLHRRRGTIMAEAFIAGREITAGIVNGMALPLIEITAASGLYDYQAKYFRDDTRYVVGPALPPGVTERCQESALAAYRLVGCRDLARVDFMVDERGPFFLEINTMPGFTGHSLVPMAARSIGIEMPELCAALVEAALLRQHAHKLGA